MTAREDAAEKADAKAEAETEKAAKTEAEAAKAAKAAAAKAAKAAAQEIAETKQPHVHRADLGEGIPTPPIKTATDND